MSLGLFSEDYEMRKRRRKELDLFNLEEWGKENYPYLPDYYYSSDGTVSYMPDGIEEPDMPDKTDLYMPYGIELYMRMGQIGILRPNAIWGYVLEGVEQPKEVRKKLLKMGLEPEKRAASEEFLQMSSGIADKIEWERKKREKKKKRVDLSRQELSTIANEIEICIKYIRRKHYSLLREGEMIEGYVDLLISGLACEVVSLYRDYSMGLKSEVLPVPISIRSAEDEYSRKVFRVVRSLIYNLPRVNACPLLLLLKQSKPNFAPLL